MATDSKLDIRALRANSNLAARNYWRTRLTGVELEAYFQGGYGPAGDPCIQGESVPGDGYAELSFPAPNGVHLRLRNLGSSHKACHIILLSALAILVRKFRSLPEAVLFTPLYADLYPGQEGHNIIPMRIGQKATEMSFKDYLNAVQKDLAADFVHGNYPIEKMLRVPVSELGSLPVTGMLVKEIQEWPSDLANPALLFSFSVSNELSLCIRYKAGEFGAGQISKLAGLYFDLLLKLIEDKGRPVKEIGLASGEERLQITNVFNDTGKTFSRQETIMDFFSRQVSRIPDRCAVKYKDEQLTYGQLDKRSNQVARFLLHKLSGRTVVAGVQMERSLELMVVLYGILKAGCAYMPMTKDCPIERANYMLKNGGIPLLFTDKDAAEGTPEGCESVHIGDTLSFSDETINRAQPDGIAYVIYTSGSTGRPKGVLIRHRSLVNRLSWMQDQYKADEGDTILQKTPIAFDVSVWELFWGCLSGSKLVMAKPGAEKDPAALAAVIAAERVSILHFVPSMLNVFLNYRSRHAECRLDSIRHLFASGEELAAADAHSFLACCPGASLDNLYGPTEATVDVSFHRVVPGKDYIKIPIGRPIDNTALYIFNRDMNLQPVGVPGELYIGGENLAAGYLNQPELTAERFVQNPLDSHTLLYKTGDLARWLPGGEIEFLGRIDTQVKIRGNRIEIGEIEHAVNSCPGIRSSAVITKAVGSGSPQLITYIVADQGISEEELRSRLSTRLPEYMIPSRFFLVDRIPTTANGKLDRNKLLAMSLPVNRPFVAPATDLERELELQWAAVLGHGPISVDDSFFRIGGDSILAVKLIAAINNEERQITVAEFYRQDTIRKLAAHIEQLTPVDKSDEQGLIDEELARFDRAYRETHSDDRDRIEVVYPMSDIEKAMCFIQKSRPEDILYFEQLMQPVTYEVLHIDVVQKALDSMVRKHEILRTGFDLDAFAHIVYKENQSALIFRDLSGLSAGDQKLQIEADLLKARSRHFDLGDQPLWRMIVIRLKDNYHEILFEYHHAVLDGWSFASLVTELNNTYGSLLRDPAFKTENLSAGYRDYIREEMIRKNQPQTRQYWKESLDGFRKLRLKTATASRAFRSVRETYPGSLVTDLEATAEKMTTTVKSILLAAHINALRTLSCETDVLIGLVTFSRPLKKDGEKVLGCFLNTVPFRVIIPPDVSWTDHLQLVDNKMLEIKNYDHLSLFEINQSVGARTYEGNPFYDTLFNVINWHVEEEIRPEKTSDEALDRLDFDSFLRGHTFFDANYNVNKERILCMHEYSSPFMDAESFADYTKIFHAGLKEIMDSPGKIIDTVELYWQRKSAEVFGQLSSEARGVFPGPGEASGGAGGSEASGRSGGSEGGGGAGGSEGAGGSGLRFPASIYQESIWGDRNAAGSPGSSICHTIAWTIDLSGNLDAGIWEGSFRVVLERHAILRTRLVNEGGKLWQRIPEGGKLRQVIPEDMALIFKMVDLEKDPLAAEDVPAAETDRPFAPGQPLLRALLLHKGRGSYTFLLVAHHSIADRGSVIRVLEEVTAVYSFLAGKDGERAGTVDGDRAGTVDGDRAYAGFSNWQRQSLIQLEPYLLSCWKQRLDFEIKPIEIASDKKRSPNAGYAKATERISIEALKADAAGFAAEEGVPPALVLMASFNVLLHIYSRQEEIAIASESDDREAFGLGGMIGPVSNRRPVWSRVLPESSFREYLRSLKWQWNVEPEMRALPFETLIENLSTEKKPGATLPFNIFFRYDDERPCLSAIEGLRMRVTELPASYGKYDLALFLREEESDLTAQFVYNSALFMEEEMKRFATRYALISRQLLSMPDRPLSETDIVSAEEKQALLRQYNNLDAEYPADKTIQELFRESVRLAPDATAVECGEYRMTYAELDRRSDTLAGILLSKGVKADSLVGLLIDRSVETIVGILAILKAGGAYLPIDVDYPEERIRFMIDDSGVSILLTTQPYRDKAPAGPEALLIDILTDLAPVLLSDNGRRSGPGNLCYVIYTSGTTGKPKGVMVEHRNVVRLLINSKFQFSYTPQDVWTMFHSHCFDVSVWEIFGALLYGGKLVIIPKSLARDTAAFLDLLKKKHVTILSQTPSAFYNLIQEELFRTGQTLQLKYVIFAGEALSPGKLKNWRKRYPETRLINMYGITETTVHVTYKEITEKEINNNISNVGRPIPTLSVYLFDSYGKLTPNGIPGELYVGGEGVARGYLGRNELTRQRFISNPYNSAEILYRSGDLVRATLDGDIEYIGRIDHQIQLRGFRIELGEIESHLASHPLISQSIVVAKEQQDNLYLVAYYLSTQEIDAVDLRRYLADKLPDYMVPSRFIRLAKIPLTANGKADLKALPEPGVGRDAGYVAAADEVEDRILEIWSRVLGLDKDLIGVQANFFDLGGHSINIITLSRMINQAFGCDLSVATMFRLTTVRSMADHIRLGEQTLQQATGHLDRDISDASAVLELLDTIQK
jgi:amino acid adenylation domain-containing protein